MLIYTALEHYPSLYKPYFDTQFVDFVDQGHKLRIFSVEPQGRKLPDKVIRAGLIDLTSHYPATLKHVPARLGLILRNYFRNPIARSRAILRIMDESSSIKYNLMNICRMLILPLTAPDLFLVHNLTTATQFTFLKRLYPGSRILLYYHGGEISGVPKLDQQEASRAFRFVDMILTNTRNSRQHAIDRGASADRVVINPVGFDIKEFEPVENRNYRQQGVLRLISIGRISWEKGFIYVLEAIAQLVRSGSRNIHYTLVGDGLELENLKAFVKRNKLEDFVDFAGHESSRAGLYERISRADALVLPSIATDSWEETQGCVLQEAMLLKTLVLTSTTGGIPESIAPQMARFSFPPEDPAAIVECINRVIELDEDEIKALGIQGRAHTCDKYDIGPLNQKILDLVGQPPAA